MTSRKWVGPGGYEFFVRDNEEETAAIVSFFNNPAALGWGMRDGYHYYLIHDTKRIITPLRKPSLAFGGQWNGYPPYHEESPCYFSLDVLHEYRLELNWSAPK